jgi:hypothetical protein
MSQRLDFMWEQMFTKTKGSTDRGKAVKGEDEAMKSTDGNSETHRAETEQPINPILHNSTRYNPYTYVWIIILHPGLNMHLSPVITQPITIVAMTLPSESALMCRISMAKPLCIPRLAHCLGGLFRLVRSLSRLQGTFCEDET